MFPKHKINHENIVNMGTAVNYTKGMIKEALFVGCLDPKEEIKICRIAESWAMHQIGKSWMEETKSKMSQPYLVSINRSNEITAVEKSNGHCFWESDLGKYNLWPDSVQQWFFCIPSSKFVNLTKFTTGTRNAIQYICPEI